MVSEGTSMRQTPTFMAFITMSYSTAWRLMADNCFNSAFSNLC